MSAWTRMCVMPAASKAGQARDAGFDVGSTIRERGRGRAHGGGDAALAGLGAEAGGLAPRARAAKPRAGR